MQTSRGVRVLGIDEAGRGCVLGPLVVGGFVTEHGDEALRAAGATDSKRLTPERRRAARIELDQLGIAVLRRVEPASIDSGNLNRLEEDVIVELIRAHAPDQVWIDALGHPATLPATVARLRAATGVAEIHMAPKADLTWPVVGAASIFAKTERDGAVDALRAPYGDFGSGYPSDPVTRAWLADWAKSGRPWPDFVRTKWETIRGFAQTALWPG